MNRKKKHIALLGTFVFAIMMTVFSLKPVEANPVLLCQWEQDECWDGSSREVCLYTGDGTYCFCGTVTRPCPPKPD